MSKSNNLFIDYNTILSYPFLFAFIVGVRGGGKTYGFKNWAIKDFLKTGKQFIYLRRYKTELTNCNLLFNDIKDKFPEHNIVCKGRTFYIDDKVAGYAVTLSNAMTKKSVPYPLVNKICFDEFVIMEGALRYIKDEVTQFLEFYETVARLRDDVKVVFCGNSISQVNPYFAYWKLFLNTERIQYFKDKYILVYYHSNREFSEEKKKTKFGSLIEGTEYGNYAMENEFYLDSYDFVEKMKLSCKLEIRIKFNRRIIGLWLSVSEGIYYASEKHHMSSVNIAITREDVDKVFKYEGNRGYFTSLIRRIFMKNMIRYENLELKNIFYDIYNKISV